MKAKNKAASQDLFENKVPTRSGLYWVRIADEEHVYIAAVHGEAPFLKIELCDPWTDAPRLRPTTKEIGRLVWLSEIPQPGGVAR